MGYKLTLKQAGFILDLFYAGLSLRRVSQLFRTWCGLPLSPATILRRLQRWVKDVDEALTYFMEKGELGFEIKLGDTWEIDEIYLPLGKKRLPLVVVRDLKTGFDVGVNFAETVSVNAVKTALENAKAVAHKCPLELRCDGLAVYESAVRDVFGSSTKLSVHLRVRDEGQNQAIEGHNGVTRGRLNVMRSLHSREKSSTIVKGIIIDYNFVRTSPALLDKTPSELAFNRSAEGIHSWCSLLELTEYYKKTVLSIQQKEGNPREQWNPTLDPPLETNDFSTLGNFTKRILNTPALPTPKQFPVLPNTKSHLSLGFVPLNPYLDDSQEAGSLPPVELARTSYATEIKRKYPVPTRLDEQSEEALLTKKGKWGFNRTEKQTTFDNSAQLTVELNKQTTLDDFST